MRLIDADALKEKYHIDLGEEVAPTVDCHDCEKIRTEIRNAVDDMKAQFCEDAISRQAVLEQTYLWSKDEFLRVTNPFDYLRKRINSLPSVTPQPKTKIGHWIYLKHNKARCSECDDVVLIAQMYGNANYCPNCGARMIEPQAESEDKE